MNALRPRCFVPLVAALLAAACGEASDDGGMVGAPISVPVPVSGAAAPAPTMEPPATTAGTSGAVPVTGAGAEAPAPVVPPPETSPPVEPPIPPPVNPGEGTPSAGCGQPWMPADAAVEEGWNRPPMLVARREIEIAGTPRVYLVAVPPDYDPARTHALVLAFHGSGGDREQLRGYMNVERAAAGEAIFVYPEGLVLPERGSTGWDTSADGADLLFVDALVDKYTTELCIDEERTFATGHSFGGCMSNAVGCFRGDLLRAIAPVAGWGPFTWGGSGCVGRVATLQIHSPKDTATEYGSAIRGCTRWLRANACDEMPACGCHWVEALSAPEDECVQEAQTPYDPGVPVEVTAEDDAPPVFRSYLGCDDGYPVVFADHYNREDRQGREERWHNPPPWAPAVIWQFFSTLPRVAPDP